ncbi:MAG: hypothetical protein WBE76_13245 [Terracidiphilus sp.]
MRPARLTITEVKVKQARILDGNKIYLYAALGMVFGILFAVGVAMVPRIHGWPGLKIDTVHAKTIAEGNLTRETKNLSASTGQSQHVASPQN